MSAYVHDLDPFAIHVAGDFGLRWYGLAYLAGFVVAFFLVRRVLRAGRSPLAPAQASDLVFTLALGAVLGARLGYIAFYQPSLLWTFSDAAPWWNALAINRGGMASHGGMIGVVVAAAIFAWRRRVPFLHVVDLAAFAAPVGLFFGRVANFINGELYGRPAPAGLPWAVKFPTEMRTWSAAQLESLRGVLAQLHQPDAGVDDVITRIQAGDHALAQSVAPLLVARHPSQLYEALLEGALMFLVVLAVWWKPKRPGVVAAVFGASYAAVRIFGEQFRLPDAPLFSLPSLELVLTRGQLLSVLLLLAAIVVAVVAVSRAVPRMGGWLRPRSA